MHANLYPIGDPRHTRILLVDNHAVFRAGLRTVLTAEADLEVVGEAADEAQALHLAHRLRPDVVLLSAASPEFDGIAATGRIRGELPATEVVLLAAHSEDGDGVVAAVRAGAIGYLRTDVRVEELLATIRAAARGEAYLSAQAAARLMREVRTAEAPLLLSHREREVLRMLGLGSSNKEIGHALVITESTVKTHVSAILAKLGAQCRTQAALHAVRLGLVSPGDLQAA